MDAGQMEDLISMVNAMPRQQLKAKFRAFRGSFPVDFTDDFLDSVPLDRLQHIFVALCMQNNSLPGELTTAAA